MSATVSIIVPCYNEQETILRVVQRILSMDHKLKCEIIVVDDGSTDRTRDILRSVTEITFLRHEVNMGKGAAVLTGARNAKGVVLVVQDADMEYDPADIPRLVEPILEGEFDVVYGSRFMGKIWYMRTSHYVGNKVLTYATRLLYGTRLTDVLTGHKAFKTDLFSKFDLGASRFEFEVDATISAVEMGCEIGEVPINYCARRTGDSKISWIDGMRCLIHLFRRRFKIRNDPPRYPPMTDKAYEN